MKRYLRGRAGNVVWWALVIYMVFLPLAALTTDVPRFFTMRTTLLSAASAAGEAAARCIDVRHYQNSGETRLDMTCVRAVSRRHFDGVTATFKRNYYSFSLDRVTVDEAADAVWVSASGSTRFLWGVLPSPTAHVRIETKYRMSRSN